MMTLLRGEFGGGNKRDDLRMVLQVVRLLAMLFVRLSFMLLPMTLLMILVIVMAMSLSMVMMMTT